MEIASVANYLNLKIIILRTVENSYHGGLNRNEKMSFLWKQ